MKKRVTQADVALRAGVSQAMVSYVINNSAVSMPLETRQRIQEAMAALGYIPNVTAQRLRTNRTATVAGIIPDITNPFYPAFERGIQDIVDDHNFDLIIYNTDARAGKEKKVIQSLLQGRVDGVIGVFFHLSAKALMPLIKQGIALVRLEAIPKQGGALPLDNIYIDNVSAAAAAVNHLIERGHRRIGILASEAGPSRFRIQGYQQALAAAQLPFNKELVCLGSYDEEGGYSAMQQMLELSPLPTAVFTINDLMALGAMLAIREAQLSVPGDIAIVGFDDIPAAKLVAPALTSISQNQRKMGQQAAQLLFERLDSGFETKGRNVEMPFELIVRTSSENRKEQMSMT